MKKQCRYDRLAANTPPFHSTLSSICKKVRTRCQRPPHKRFLLLIGCCASFLRLTEQLTALRDWCNVCLASENPTCSVPALYLGMRGSMLIRLWTCMAVSTSPPPFHSPVYGIFSGKEIYDTVGGEVLLGPNMYA